MNTVDIKYFGKIENPPHEEIYEASVCFEEAEVDLDLNFLNGKIDSKWSENLIDYLEELGPLKQRLEKVITSDFRDGGVVREYIDFHIEDDPIILVDLFDDASLKSDREQLIDALKLERISFYPGDEKFAIWNFSIGRDYTDQLIVIATDKKGRVEVLTWES